MSNSATKDHKRSKNLGYSKNFYFTIVSYVKEHNKLPHHLMSKQALNYYVRKLVSDGVLHKLGYGVWEANLERFEEVKKLEEVKIQGNVGVIVRGHGYHYKIVLNSAIRNWDKREEYLRRMGIEYITSKGLWRGQRLIIDDYKVWLCDRCIVIYAPKSRSFYSDSAGNCYKYALFELKEVLMKLEDKLNINLKPYKIKISKQHYGKINDSLAKQYNKDGTKLRCSLYGKEWLVIDNSYNLNEIETVNSKTSQEDMDKVVIPFFNSLKEHYDRTGESPSFLDIVRALSEQAKINDMYAQNMVSHIDAVRKLGSGVENLNNSINNFKGELSILTNIIYQLIDEVKKMKGIK